MTDLQRIPAFCAHKKGAGFPAPALVEPEDLKIRLPEAIVAILIFKGGQRLPEIGLIALQVTCFPAVRPVDDLFTFADFLSTGVTNTGKLCRDLPGIEGVTCMTHVGCFCPEDLFWHMARR